MHARIKRSPSVIELKCYPLHTERQETFVMKFRVLITGFALAVMSVLVANCSGSAQPTQPPPIRNSPVANPGTSVAIPTVQVLASYTDPARTVAPASGPTVAPIIENSVKFVNAAPPFIGRWGLDKNRSYVNQRFPGGAVLMYSAPGLGSIQVSYWLIFNEQIPQYNINNAIDRFNLETSLIQVPKIPVALGDQALISPANRKPQEKTGANPTLLGIVQWRNIVIDIYATPELLQSNFDFTEAEATDFLTKMFNAVPK
jgi:hypothetical protein